MFEATAMLYLYVETPLHAGSGSSVGVVDLPIQRERVTGYPLVQASGIKGKLRAEAYESTAYQALKAQHATRIANELKASDKWQDKSEADREREAARRARKTAARELGLEAIFGPESDEADLHAGAMSPGDARLLLFPVRSLAGVYAYTTSRNVLARLKRDLDAQAQMTGQTSTITWTLDNLPDNGKAWTVDNNTTNNNSVVVNGAVVLEEFAFTAQQHNAEGQNEVAAIAAWLAENAFPASAEYAYFREKVKTHLVILPEDAFRDFTHFATEILARIRINQETKTVASGALWTEEHLPSDTLLYAPLLATRPRTAQAPTTLQTAHDVIKFVRDLGLARIQLGGDETVGRGIVRLNLK